MSDLFLLLNVAHSSRVYDGYYATYSVHIINLFKIPNVKQPSQNYYKRQYSAVWFAIVSVNVANTETLVTTQNECIAIILAI